MNHSRLCGIAECSKPHRARGWCSTHYNRWSKHGDPEVGQILGPPVLYEQCRIRDCSGSHLARGWCRKHYYRWYHHGDPYIVLTNNVPVGTYGDCALSVCGRKAVVKGLCQGHYLSTVVSPRRRAQKLGATVNDFTPEQWQQTLEDHNHLCAYCGESDENLTQDHVIPLSKGGNHTASNIVPACRFCNSSKGSRLLEEWLVSVDDRSPISYTVSTSQKGRTQ